MHVLGLYWKLNSTISLRTDCEQLVAITGRLLLCILRDMSTSADVIASLLSRSNRPRFY